MLSHRPKGDIDQRLHFFWCAPMSLLMTRTLLLHLPRWCFLHLTRREESLWGSSLRWSGRGISVGRGGNAPCWLHTLVSPVITLVHLLHTFIRRLHSPCPFSLLSRPSARRLNVSARHPSHLLLAPPKEVSQDGAVVMGPGDKDHLPDHQVPGCDKGRAPRRGLGSGGFQVCKLNPHITCK